MMIIVVKGFVLQVIRLCEPVYVEKAPRKKRETLETSTESLVDYNGTSISSQ